MKGFQPLPALLLKSEINSDDLLEMFDIYDFDEYSEVQEGNFHSLEQIAIEATNELADLLSARF